MAGLTHERRAERACCSWLISASRSPVATTWRTAVSEARVITHEVPLRTGSTWYRVLGDWPFRALLAGVLGLSWWGARRRASALTPPAAP